MTPILTFNICIERGVKKQLSSRFRFVIDNFRKWSLFYSTYYGNPFHFPLEIQLLIDRVSTPMFQFTTPLINATDVWFFMRLGKPLYCFLICFCYQYCFKLANNLVCLLYFIKFQSFILIQTCGLYSLVRVVYIRIYLNQDLTTFLSHGLTSRLQ